MNTTNIPAVKKTVYTEFAKRAKPENCTPISSIVFVEKSLSWQAMGMLGYLLAQPEGFEFTAESLVDVTAGAVKETHIKGVYAILLELKKAGFIKTRRNHGILTYVVSDLPLFKKVAHAKNMPSIDEARV